MNIGTVFCILPEQEYEDERPREWHEDLGWRTSEFCTHDYCIEAASYARQWRAERGYRESVAQTRIDIDSNETSADLTDEELHQVQMRLK